ncbi:MAG: hypothetical protein ACKO4T_10770 [Planctomycetaceae bacterium]
MRSPRRIIATVVVAAVSASLAIGVATAQETTVMDGSAMMSTDGAGSACGCRNMQQPPWHASVSGPACGPSCHHCGVFHADPCGQLRAKHEAHRHCVTLPPCFPRLHTWCTEGFMPTPRPLALPRCHQCGAVIEGGL